ncbi:hypothetical protein PMIN04_011846 [Paraphaeosphaeria minitans]
MTSTHLSKSDAEKTKVQLTIASKVCKKQLLVEELNRKLADQDARIGRLQNRLWNMGDWLVSLGYHFEEAGRILKREAGGRKGDEGKQAATGEKRKKTHST